MAPPGSGKTILGLELLRRIGKPTIVLAPTITIRNQWASRLIENFTTSEESPEWLSTDIKNPRHITISTYQGLFSILKNSEPEPEQIDFEKAEEEDIEIDHQSESDRIMIPGDTTEETKLDADEDLNASHFEILPPTDRALKFIEKLKELEIRTIVVDEAHHLRNEWWKSLTLLKENISKPVIVALTATPPYDVSRSEWKRYEEFCGPIDLEVPIPDLIRNNVICPHQDFLFFSEPTEAESKIIRNVKVGISDALTTLKDNKQLIDAVGAHPAVADPFHHQEEIFDSPQYFASLCAFFHHCGQSDRARQLTKLLTTKESSAITFTPEYAEIFLRNVLFHDPYFRSEQFSIMVKQLYKICTHAGIVERREVNLKNPKILSKILSQSQSKIFAVQTIVNAELHSLGSALRCVVLTDFIRKEYLPTSQETKKYERIGVIPIFEELRKSLDASTLEKTCVLTGTIVIVPRTQSERITKEILTRDSNSESSLSFHTYSGDENFLILKVTDTIRQHVVQSITDIFESGEINVIIGTRSLLGEGWDAPSINTLILASDVRSFMMSNQMRGRAIRVSPHDKNKVANIWHIAAISPEIETIPITKTEITFGFGPEYNSLRSRFETFVGICSDRLGIQSGISRIDTLPKLPIKGKFERAMLRSSNLEQIEMSTKREETRKKWLDSIRAGANGKIVSMLETETSNIPEFPRSFFFAKSYRVILGMIISLWGYLLYQATAVFELEGNIFALFLAIILISIYPLYRLFKLFKLWATQKSPEINMDRICKALLFALYESRHIKTGPAFCKITIASPFASFGIACSIDGLPLSENNIVLNALEEVYSPIDNPRYIMRIGTRNPILGISRPTWLAVPSIFKGKEDALAFQRSMCQHVTHAKFFYTRSESGRRELLKARKYSVINRVYGKQGRKTVWQ